MTVVELKLEEIEAALANHTVSGLFLEYRAYTVLTYLVGRVRKAEAAEIRLIKELQEPRRAEADLTRARSQLDALGREPEGGGDEVPDVPPRERPTDCLLSKEDRKP